MLPDKWFAACAHSENMGDAQYVNAIFLAGMVRHVRQKLAKSNIPIEMQMLLPEQVYHRLCDGS
jgi:hypothetical protein